jgi:hypothetical protein
MQPHARPSEEEMELAEAGEPGLGPPPWLSDLTTVSVAGELGSRDVTLDEGTAVFACIPFDAETDETLGIFAAGPVEVTA